MEREDGAVLSNEQKIDVLQEQLADASARLRAAQKALRRDWEHLTPRTRSEGSRQIKQLEQQCQALRDELTLE